MAFEKDVPDWKSEGTKFPDSKLVTGWIEAEKPPANWFNYLFFKTFQAIKELQAKASEKDYIDEKVKEIDDKKINKVNIVNITGTSEGVVMSQKGTTEAIDELKNSATGTLDKKVDKSDIVSSSGYSTNHIMNQKAVTDALLLKIDKSLISQSTGSSTSTLISQKGITDLYNAQDKKMTDGLLLKIDKSSISNSAGTSENTLISQKGVTEEMAKKFDKANIAHSAGTSTEKVMSQNAVKVYVESAVPKISSGTMLPTTGNNGDIFILYK